MKKSIKTALFIALALICAFAFASCGLFGDKDKDGDGSGNNNNNNNNNNSNNNGTEQAITTSAAWDKVMNDTWTELTKSDANYKIAQSGKEYYDDETEEYQRTFYIAGNKSKAIYCEPQEDDEVIYYYEIANNKLYEYWSVDGGTNWDSDFYNNEYSSIGVFMNEYHCAVNIKGLVGKFDCFTYADGVYTAKEEKRTDIFTALYGHAPEPEDETTDFQIKITDGKVSKIFMVINSDDMDEQTMTFTYGGQTVTLPNVG